MNSQKVLVFFVISVFASIVILGELFAAEPVIKGVSTQVVVPVNVLDYEGNPVVGLKKRDFILRVDGKKIEDFQFLYNNDIPIGVGVSFDHSSRVVRSHLGWIKRFVSGMIHQFSYEDVFFLSTYGWNYAEIQPPTSDRIEIMETLRNIYPNQFSERHTFWQYFKASIKDYSKIASGPPANKTAIAIDFCLNKFSTLKKPKRVLVLISDGDENLSKITLHHIQSYPVAIFCIYFPGTGIGQRSLFRRGAFLRRISSESGGRVFKFFKAINPAVIGKRISVMIKNQYVLSFTPNMKMENRKTHSIEVTVKRKDIRITYRKSFRFMKE